MPRILLVDDEINLTAALRRGLVSAGFEVDIAHDGQDALWRATVEEFDAIVLDVMLPVRSGPEVVSRLRAVGIGTPILMLTARTADAEQAEALDLGADDYLTKPVSMQVLTAHLRALLRRVGSDRDALLTVGDLVLDPGSHRVSRAGQPVQLSPREFSLLEYFMREPAVVHSRVDLIDEVWAGNSDGPSNVVEVYVGYLRRKIDVPFGVASLVTVRGFGYRLDAVDVGGSVMVT